MRSHRPFLGATTVDINITDQTGTKSVRAKISPDVPMSDLLPNIITHLRLPITAPDGSPMSYSLDWKEGGVRLLETDTISSSGIRPGDHLIVYPEIVAGELGCSHEGAYMGAAGDILELDILDQTGSKKIRAKISSNMAVEDILPNIITHLRLPITAPDGSPMSYSLDWKEGGVRLLEGQTLEDAGVRTDHHLIVYPEIVAGWRRGR